MSEPMVVKKALEAVRGDDLEEARGALMEALTEYPERLDLVHTLAIIELQVGRPDHALDLTQKASALALERRDPGDLELLPLLLLAQGAAHEELNQPAQSLQAYEAILSDHRGIHSPLKGRGTCSSHGASLSAVCRRCKRSLMRAPTTLALSRPRRNSSLASAPSSMPTCTPATSPTPTAAATRPSSHHADQQAAEDGSPKLRGCAAERTGGWSR